MRKKINSFFQRIKSNMFWKSVVVLVSGNVIAQVIGILTIPIVTRLYDPVAFGEFTLIFSVASIILNIVTLGLTSAVMVAVNDDESSDIFTVAFFTILFLSTLVLILMISTSHYLQFFNPTMPYSSACLLVYGFILINGLNGLLGIYVNRKGLNRVLFYNAIIAAFSTIFLKIPFGILKFGSYGLIWAALIAGIISTIQMVYHSKPFKRLPDFQTIKAVFKKYRDFVVLKR